MMIEQPDIKLGVTLRNTWRQFLWKHNAGMLLAGNPGTGKSQTAAWYITQFAAKGVKILLGEYAAYSMEGEGLVDRCQHITPAFYLPPTQTGSGLIEYIDIFKELADTRLDPIKGKTVEHFPIMFVIDEFSALMLDYQKQIPIEKLRSMAMTMRKANMRMMIIGQSWAQLGRQLPQLRVMFDQVICHRLMRNNAELFTQRSDEVDIIQRLEPGWALKDGDKIYVPSALRGYNLERFRSHILAIHGEGHGKAMEVPSHSLENGPNVSVGSPSLELQQRIDGGQSNYKIIKEMYGVTGGRKFAEHAEYVNSFRSKKGLIYLAMNKENGRCYIGQTIQDLRDRQAKHRSDAASGSTHLFHCAIREFGWDSFEWKILEECAPDDINRKEKEWILLYTLNEYALYNMTRGG